MLRATLPEGTDLKSVSKQWFADAILSPDGDIVRSGVVAEGGRISRSQMIVDCSAEDAPKPCMVRRRLILKYDTVTGSGVQTVERRGLVEAYELEGDVYMMLTTSNAVKVSTALLFSQYNTNDSVAKPIYLYHTLSDLVVPAHLLTLLFHTCNYHKITSGYLSLIRRIARNEKL